MLNWQRSSVCGAVLGAFLALCPPLSADYVVDLSEGRKLTLGADVRVRLTHFDRDVIHPGLVPDGMGGWRDPLPNGPALEYIRVRERVWGSLQLEDGVSISARLTNRWHHYSSNIGDNNTGAGTWQFPDEVVVDQLKLDIKEIADSNWSVTLGRQDVFFGNGMIFLEGTPYDQGRSIYFDGATLRYETEADKLAFFAYYSKFKDTAVFINDQNRPLRRGDILTGGVYWTHHLPHAISTDLYYIYSNVSDDDPMVGARNHPANSNSHLNIVGGRVFGNPHALFDYSLEYARQFGEGADGVDYTGCMLDARLQMKMPEDTLFDPVFMLQFTSLSGDDPRSSDEYEGWDPIYTEYPIWREELLPIMLNGNWTNLKQYRAQTVLTFTEKLSFTGAYSYLTAEYGEAAPGFGGGNTIGQLLSGFLDYKVNEHLSFALEAAGFMAGSYWVGGQDCTWLRFQTVYRF